MGIPIKYPKVKKIGKYYYRHYSHYYYKSSAKEEAQRLRKKGFRARVLRYSGLWMVYKA